MEVRSTFLDSYCQQLAAQTAKPSSTVHISVITWQNFNTIKSILLRVAPTWLKVLVLQATPQNPVLDGA